MVRPDVVWTARVLAAGTLISAVCFVVGFVLNLVGADASATGPGRDWSNAGVITLLATPAAGLVATALELRHVQPRSAALALAVLGILAIAVAVALLGQN